MEQLVYNICVGNTLHGNILLYIITFLNFSNNQCRTEVLQPFSKYGVKPIYLHTNNRGWKYSNRTVI